MEINTLIWDTEFFGFSIGKLSFKEKENVFDIKKFLNKAKDYKLVYVFSDFNLSNISELKLVDEKVLFHKTIVSKTIDPGIIEYDVENHDYNQLLDLALVSGINSRFKIDENFSSNEYEKLYKKWLDKSIDIENETKVLLESINNKITGLVTVDKTNDDVATIGLLAVNGEFRGRNIASRLLNHVESSLEKNAFKFLEVATQKNNLPAMNLYQKNNFKIKKHTYIYHFWNL